MVAVIISPALRLPAMRLRMNRLSLPPSMPAPMPHPPSACSGVAVCWLAAIRLPAMTDPFCGSSFSWWSELVVSPTRLPSRRLPTTYMSSLALVPS